LPAEKVIEKSLKLLRSDRVECLSDGRFNVVGDHGTYTVVETLDGKITCNCPGFASKGVCSHQVAVMILTRLQKYPEFQRLLASRKRYLSYRPKLY